MSKKNNHDKNTYKLLFHIRVIYFCLIGFFLVVAGMVFLQTQIASNRVLGVSTDSVTACNCAWWNILCRFRLGIPFRYPCNTPTPTPTARITYKGIYQFVGQQNSGNATKPYLKGALLNYYWSQIEPSKGNFQWNAVETDMKPWTDAGKFIILRISTSGNCYQNQPGSCSRTPSWVYAEGAKSVKDPKTGAVYPDFFDSIFQEELKQFIQQYATHFDGNQSVAYIDAAVGNDGETVISKDEQGQAYALWQPLGYTDAKWLATIKTIVTFYGESFHKTPFAVQPDKTFIQPKKTKGTLSEMALLKAVVDLHTQYPNSMFQNDSLSPKQSLPVIWNAIPLSLEQGQAAGNSTLLQQEMQSAMSEKGSYILVFTKDINNVANQTILQNAANTLGD